MPHQRKQYAMSRGMMALAYFDYKDAESFLNQFNFDEMELVYNDSIPSR